MYSGAPFCGAERNFSRAAIKGTSGVPRHTKLTRYRCSLPGLAGFAGNRCTEPEVPSIGSRTKKKFPRDCEAKFSTAPQTVKATARDSSMLKQKNSVRNELRGLIEVGPFPHGMTALESDSN